MRGQLARLRAARARGMPRRGWKLGINVPAVHAWLEGMLAMEEEHADDLVSSLEELGT